MMLVPARQRTSFRERVSRALNAVRSYTISGLLSSDKKTAAIFGAGAKTDAGIVVTARNAFTFSAVFDAVNQGSSDIGKLPLNLLKTRKEGGTDHFTASRTYRLLKDEPNPEMSAMDMRQTLQAHAMTLKGCFCEIERDGAGRPFWLWPITPDRVEEKREYRAATGKEDGAIYYSIDGGQSRIPARDMLHIKGLGYDGLTGYSTIDKARQAIGLALAAEKFGASFFADGAGFPGLLGIKNAVGPESMNKLREHVDTQYGPGSWNRFLILDNDPNFIPFGVEPQKAQMNELRSKQVEEVARFFNFPVHKLKNLDRATNNNIEQQDLEYYKGFILNWTTKWEQECNRKLIPPLERGQQYFKHNVNAFLRGDTAARTGLYTALLDRGVFNADIVLDLEDMNPQPNGLGKMYLVNSTMVPKDKIEKIADKAAQPTPPPAPPQDPGDPDDDDDVSQDDVDQANDRAAKAEHLAEESRVAAGAAEKRAAELAGAATASESLIAEARATAAAETARAAVAEALALECRRTAEIVQQQFTDVEAERVRLVAEIEAQRVGRDADVERLEAGSRAAIDRASAAERAAEQAHAAVAIATTEAQAAAAARVAAQADADRLAGELAEARAELARQQGDVAVAETRHREAIDAAETRVTETQARAEAAAGRLAALERAVDAERTARRGQVSAEIAAHRALVVDITRRMVERETERARRNQATPDKVRAWIASFYDGHADLMRTALLPAVRIHLAWIGSTEDPGEVTRQIVARHVEESQRQIRVLLDGDADHMAGSLPALLHRWDTERIEVIADALMQKELDHVRER